MKVVREIKMCLNEIYSKVHIRKHLSGAFPIQNDQKQGDAFSPLLSNFSVEYAIRKVHENQVGLKLVETYKLLIYAVINILDDNINIIKENTEALIDASNEVDLKVDVEKSIL
jgi:hypothetical protein